jgi:hypothetical protein
MRIVPERVEAPPAPSALLRRSPRIEWGLDCAPAFVRDTDLRVRFRTFVFDRRNPDESKNDAWALGGWLQYVSGWAGGVFSIGATGYTSQPLWAPEDRDGTSILEPGQEPIEVLGQAFARVRYRDYAMLTVYRQSIDDGYLNPQDNRMVPNTFEGVTLKGEGCGFAYDLGYVWAIKPRNRDEFIPMSEHAGADGDDQGMWFASVTLEPRTCVDVHLATYHLNEVYNTVFVRARYQPGIRPDLDGRFGVQWTDQRSVGEERLGNFQTWNLGAGAGLKWSWGLNVGVAAHVTGEDASIRSNFGTWPGWLSMIETDFDRAGEKAWGVAVAFDFGDSRRLCVPGLTARFAYVQGTDRVDPATGGGLPTTREWDVDLIYNVPRVKGLQFRLRNAYVDVDGPVLGYQFRFIVNYEIELL